MSVTHRTAMTFPAYLAESLLNPIPLAVIGFALRPGPRGSGHAGRVRRPQARPGRGGLQPAAGRALLLAGLRRRLGEGRAALSHLGPRPLDRTVLWRGNRLRVLPGGGLAAFSEGGSEEVAESFPALHAPAAAAWSNVQA